jgi:hypothetical protein
MAERATRAAGAAQRSTRRPKPLLLGPKLRAALSRPHRGWILELVSISDTLENGADPRPAVRRTAAALGLVVIVAVVAVSIYRSAEQRRERVSFDRLLTLSAAGEASVERAQSEARDVAQYAEPLLTSSLTPKAARDTLYVTLSASARQGHTDIDAQLRLLTMDPTGRSGRLRTAREATIAYLSDWSALFARAGGAADAPAGSQNDLIALHRAARAALEKAAPDAKRAARASTVLGTISE